MPAKNKAYNKRIQATAKSAAPDASRYGARDSS